jgi:hypothetical protein
MKRSGILRRGRETAQADWNAFARNLGQDFFATTVEKGLSKTLIPLQNARRSERCGSSRKRRVVRRHK